MIEKEINELTKELFKISLSSEIVNKESKKEVVKHFLESKKGSVIKSIDDCVLEFKQYLDSMGRFVYEDDLGLNVD